MGKKVNEKSKRQKNFKQSNKSSTVSGTKGVPIKRKKQNQRHENSNVEDISSNNENPGSRSRQTVLSEFFTTPNTSPTPTKCDESREIMVDFKRLLNQILSAKVVIERIPDDTLAKYQSVSTTKNDDDSQRTTSVQRYCYKCKTLEFDHSNIKRQKNCRKCDTLLIYVCMKCNENHFIHYNHMRKHFNVCSGHRKSTENALSSVTLIYCADCSFKASKRKPMQRHVSSTKHEVLGGKKVLDEGKRKKTHWKKVEEFKKFQAKFVLRKTNTSYLTAYDRYCSSCKSDVIGTSSSDSDACRTCGTLLQYQCIKCSFKAKHHSSIKYHVETKCYPSIFRCPKCKFTAPCWKLMDIHLKNKGCVEIASIS